MAERKARQSTLRRLDDAQLANLLKTPDWGGALSVLWDRHAGLLYSTARSLCRSDDDARDALSDALAKIAQRSSDNSISIDTSFKSYAVMVVRNSCHDMWRRTGRVDVTEEVDLDRNAGGSFLPDPVLDDLDEKYVAVAFSRLPERYRQVLWLTEVEGLPPREVAELLSMTPNNVSQIAVRARTALREGWAAEHLTQVDAGSPCHDFAKLLPAFAAGSLASARVESLEAHLAGCTDCTSLRKDLMADTMKLRGLALPVPILLTFRHLRKIAGGAAQTSGQTAGVLGQTLEVARRAAGVVQTFVTSAPQAVLVGVGTVAAVATVSVGTIAITNIGGDRSGDADRSGEEFESGSEASTPESGATSSPTESSAVETTVLETTVPPETTVAETTVAAQTTVPQVSTLPSIPPRPPDGPDGSITNDSIITLRTPIPANSSRSWTYQARAGSTFLVTSTGGFLNVYNSSSRSVSSSIVEPTNGETLPDWRVVQVPESGRYTVVLSAGEVDLPASTKLLISTNTTELQPNTPTRIGTELPYGLGRIWKFEGVGGEPIAVGVENQYPGVAVISPGGNRIGCSPACMLPEDGTYSVVVVNGPMNWLPDTQSANMMNQSSSPDVGAQPMNGGGNYPTWTSNTRVEFATPTFDVAVDVPKEVEAPSNWGFYRIGRFTGGTGNMRACFTTYGIDCWVFDQVWSWRVARVVGDSNWIVLRRYSSFGATDVVEVVSPAGATTLGAVNEVPPGHLGALWSIQGSAGDVVATYAPWDEVSPYSFRFLVSPNSYDTWGGWGLSCDHGYFWWQSTNCVLPQDGTYYVGVGQDELVEEEPQWVSVTGVSGDLVIDEPSEFTGDIHDWRRGLWRFEAEQGDVVYSRQAARLFRVREYEDPSWWGIEYVSNCPCMIPETGTYYMSSRLLSEPPESVKVGQVRSLHINQVYDLPEALSSGAEIFFRFYLPSPSDLDLLTSGGEWDSALLTRWDYGFYDSVPVVCDAFPCNVSEGGSYILSIKAGLTGFPAGMQFLLSAPGLPIGR